MTRLLDRILNRRRNYRLLFLDGDNRPNRAAEAVLADLRRFCRAQSSTAAVNPLTRSVDPLAIAMAEGRREVWNRIQAHLILSDRDITHLQEEP